MRYCISIFKEVTCWVLILAFSLSLIPTSWAVEGASTQPTPPTTQEEGDKPLGGRDPKVVIEEAFNTAATRSLNTKELVDISFAYLMEKKHGEAILAARLGLGTTQNKRQLAAIHCLIAQNLALTGEYGLAGKEALVGQRILGQELPDEDSLRLAKTLAAQRIGFFSQAGDEQQRIAAEDYLKSLAPNYEPKSLTAVKIGALVVGGAITAGLFIYRWVTGEKLTAEDTQFLGTMWTSIGVLAAVPAP